MQDNSQDLPDYKRTFLSEMDQLRNEELERSSQIQQTGAPDLSQYFL